MKRQVYLVCLMLMLVLLVACTSDDSGNDPTEEVTVESSSPITLSLSGSGSLTPVFIAIVDDFEDANPGYVLEVLSGSGTGGGVRGVISGVLDVAAMSRPPSDSEAEQGVEFTQFGNSITVVMTHTGVGISSLTSEQLSDIFAGTITNWSEVGGPDLDITVYIRDPEEGNTVDIREAYIDDVEFVESAQLMGSQTDMQNILASIEGAIGYGTWAAAVANEADVTILSVDDTGTENPSENIMTLMGIGYLSNRVEDVQPLIDWLLSEDGRVTLSSMGVIPIDEE